jgi:predicted permease
MLTDLRVGLRLLWKDKTFTLASATTLAVCIAANVALFAIVDHILLRPLPLPDADGILLMSNQYPGASVDVSSSSGVPDYFDRLRDVNAYETQAMYNWDNVSINRNGSPARVVVMNVTPSFFRVIGLSAAAGRTFTDDEGEPGNEHAVVVSYGFWQSALGADSNAVGRDVRLDGRPYKVVGVMPRTFSFFDEEEPVSLWRPLAFTAEQKSDERRHSNGWRNIGKLKQGSTIEQAQQQVDALNARNLDRFPQYKQLLIDARFHTTVEKLQDNVVRDVKPTLYLLWGGAFFVLLIGSVNVANLVLVRTSARFRDVATRIALGAGRWQIARQLVLEHLLLTMIAAVGGLLAGAAALRLLGALDMLNLPRAQEIRIDAVVILNVTTIAAAIGIVFGLIAVAHVASANPAAVLTQQGRTTAGGRGTRLARRALVVLQVGFAFVLLIGAGLLLASFRRVLAVDPGFNVDQLLTAKVTLPSERYKDDPSLVTFTSDALRRLRALPGVTGVGVTDTIPFGRGSTDNVIFAEGYQMRPGESVISPNQIAASPGYFEAVGAKLVHGRFFDSRDGAAGPKTAIVDEKLARRFWPDQDPVGRRLYLPTDINNLMAITEKTVFITVVGVVHDIKFGSLIEGNGEVGAYYFPIDQSARRELTFALRSAVEPSALAGSVRSALRDLDAELPVYDVRTMTERLNRSLGTRRAAMRLAIAFGGVALLLAAIGVYGVLAYSVVQRTKEIGIRIALGSSTAAVFQLVLREGLVLVAAGFLLGAGGLLALKRSLDSLLFGVSAADPAVLIGVTTMLAVVAMLAGALPARRATRIEPTVALAD